MIPLIYINNTRACARKECSRSPRHGDGADRMDDERRYGTMREKEIEKYLVDRVAQMGGMALKFISPGCTGVPDRLVILPGGKIGFLELKAPGMKPRKEQVHRIRQLWGLRCCADVADTREAVDLYLASLSKGAPFPAGMSHMLETEAHQ